MGLFRKPRSDIFKQIEAERDRQEALRSIIDTAPQIRRGQNNEPQHGTLDEQHPMPDPYYPQELGSMAIRRTIQPGSLGDLEHKSAS